MVKLKASKGDGSIIISEDSFEHLLNCLDNQKFLYEINADALTCNYKKTQQEMQAVIDDFNRQCRKLLHSDSVNDKHNKFWTIEIVENKDETKLYNFVVKTTYGKVGTTGRSSYKTYWEKEVAYKSATKLIMSKRKKGYVEKR